MHILYVHGGTALTAQDTTTVGYFTAAGHTVTTQADTVAAPTTGYDVAYLAESVSSSNTGTRWNNATIPFVLADTFTNTMRMTSAALVTATTGNQYLLDTHPITESLVSPLQWRTTNVTGYGQTTANLRGAYSVIARNSSASTSCTIVVWDTNATMATGTAQSRRGYIGGGITTSPNSWTEGMKTLVLRTMSWCAGILGSTPVDPGEASATLTSSWTYVGSAVGSTPPGPPGSLPGEIPGVEPEAHQNVKPWMASNGNLYRLTEANVDAVGGWNQPRMMRSTDGGSTWTEQDALNRPGYPSTVGDLEAVGAWHDKAAGTIVISWEQSSRVTWTVFATSDHSTNPNTWLTGTVRERVDVSGTTPGENQAVVVSKCDDGSYWIFYSKLNGSLQGVTYRKRTGPTAGVGTYGAELQLSAKSIVGIQGGRHGSLTHLIYKDFVNNQLWWRTLADDGTLGDETRLDTSGTDSASGKTFHVHTAPAFYTTGGIDVMTVLFTTGSQLRSISVHNGVIQSEEIVHTTPPTQDPSGTASDAMVADLVSDGSNLHAIWSDSSSGNVLYSVRAHGATWSVPTILVDIPNDPSNTFAINGDQYAQWTYAQVNTYPSGFKNGAKVLSYTYDVGPHADDDSNIFYNEVVLVQDPPSPTIPTATLSGNWTYSGSAEGKRTAKAVVSSSYTYSGVSSGKRIAKAFITSAYSYLGSAAGKRAAKASGTGAYNYLGSVSGKRVAKASGTGAYSYLSSASGKRVAKATFVGAYNYLGSATGKRVAKATVLSAYAYLGSVSGKRIAKASYTSIYNYLSSATGRRVPKSSTSNSWSFISEAVGYRPPNPDVPTATLTSSWTYLGTAIGLSPTVEPIPVATYDGSYSFTGIAYGKRRPKTTLSNSYGYTGHSIGKRNPKAQHSGALRWNSSSVGYRSPQAELVATYTYLGVLVGKRIPVSILEANYFWLNEPIVGVAGPIISYDISVSVSGPYGLNLNSTGPLGRRLITSGPHAKDVTATGPRS